MSFQKLELLQLPHLLCLISEFLFFLLALFAKVHLHWQRCFVHKGAAWLVQAVSNRVASVTKTEDFEKSHAKSHVFLQTFHVLGVFDLYYRVSVVNI